MKVRASVYTVGNVLVYKFQIPSALNNRVVCRGSEIALLMATRLQSTADAVLRKGC